MWPTRYSAFVWKLSISLVHARRRVARLGEVNCNVSSFECHQCCHIFLPYLLCHKLCFVWHFIALTWCCSLPVKDPVGLTLALCTDVLIRGWLYRYDLHFYGRQGFLQGSATEIAFIWEKKLILDERKIKKSIHVWVCLEFWILSAKHLSNLVE